MIKESGSDSDSYLWLVDPEPGGGQKHVDPVNPDPDPQHWSKQDLKKDPH